MWYPMHDECFCTAVFLVFSQTMVHFVVKVSLTSVVKAG